MLDISKIKDLINEVIEKENIDRTHLYNNGAIYYKNGNDGTEFDYECNDMTCEFMVFWKNDCGALKLNQRRNKFDIFVYDENDPFGGNYKEYQYESPFDLYELCCYLLAEFDYKGIYDKEIKNWKLEEKCEFVFDDEDEGRWY